MIKKGFRPVIYLFLVILIMGKLVLAATTAIELKEMATIPLKDIKKPAGLAVDMSGWIYITDALSQEVAVYNREGQEKFRFGKEGKGKLVIPWGIAVTSANIYVTDIGDHSIKVYDLRGVFLFEFGSEGDGKGEFQRPYDLAFDSKNNIYVVDSGNYRIQVFNEKGRYKTEFGSQGTKIGEFGFPVAIAIDSKDRLYIVDSLNCGVQVFDTKGNFILKLGLCGTKTGELIDPQGISVDKDGFVYVSDAGNYRVQIYDSEGVFIQDFKGRTGLFTPNRSEIVKGNIYYFIDKDNNLIEVYQISSQLSAEAILKKEKIEANEEEESEYVTSPTGETRPVKKDPTRSVGDSSQQLDREQNYPGGGK